MSTAPRSTRFAQTFFFEVTEVPCMPQSRIFDVTIRSYRDGIETVKKSTILNQNVLSLNETSITYAEIDPSTLLFNEKKIDFMCNEKIEESDDDITYEFMEELSPLPKPLPCPILDKNTKLVGIKRNRDFLKRANAAIKFELSPEPARKVKIDLNQPRAIFSPEPELKTYTRNRMFPKRQ